MEYGQNYFDPADQTLHKLRHSKVSQFQILISLAPYPFNDLERTEASRVLYERLFETIISSGLRRSCIEFLSKINLNTPLYMGHASEAEDRQKSHWYTMRYNEPGKSFDIKMSDTRFEISCSGLILSTLVELSSEVFQAILNDLSRNPLDDCLRIHERVTALDYIFRCEYRIEKDKIQRDLKKNHQLIQKSLNLENSVSNLRSETNAFPSLGIESFIRLDFNQQGLKMFHGENYNVKLRAEAPYNEGNSIIFVMAAIAMEEEFGFDLLKAINVELAFVDFYRDIVLRRVVDNLFCSVDYQTV